STIASGSAAPADADSEAFLTGSPIDDREHLSRNQQNPEAPSSSASAEAAFANITVEVCPERTAESAQGIVVAKNTDRSRRNGLLNSLLAVAQGTVLYLIWGGPPTMGARLLQPAREPAKRTGQVVPDSRRLATERYKCHRGQ